MDRKWPAGLDGSDCRPPRGIRPDQAALELEQATAGDVAGDDLVVELRGRLETAAEVGFQRRRSRVSKRAPSNRRAGDPFSLTR